MTYEKSFKEEALKLADEIGTKKQQNSWVFRITLLRPGGSEKNSMESKHSVEVVVSN